MKVLAIIGWVLVVMAALLFIAGSPESNIIPQNHAIFFGVAAVCAGVLAWIIYGVMRWQDVEH